MHIQLNNLTFSKFVHEKTDVLEFPDLTESRERIFELFNLERRVEKAKKEFIIKNCKRCQQNELKSDNDFLKTERLKNRFLKVM